MDLDLLYENYPMVVSKLPFEQFDQASLIGSSQTCQIRVSTYVPLFLGKACVPWNIYSAPELHRNNVKRKNTKQIYF
jgi:hypothetical protein